MLGSISGVSDWTRTTQPRDHVRYVQRCSSLPGSSAVTSSWSWTMKRSKPVGSISPLRPKEEFREHYRVASRCGSAAVRAREGAVVGGVGGAEGPVLLFFPFVQALSSWSASSRDLVNATCVANVSFVLTVGSTLSMWNCSMTDF